MAYKKDNGRSNIKDQKVRPKGPREEFERKKLLRKQAKKKARRKKLIVALITIFFIIIIVPIFIVGSFITSLDKGDLMEGIAPKLNEPLNILLVGMDTGDVTLVENITTKKTDTMII